MAFYKRQDIGRIYVIKLVLPDSTTVHKIGMCHSPRSVDRMMEILRSWFTKFRFVPYSELRLDMECHNPKELEAYIHRILSPVAFEPHHKVQGGTEMFTEINEVRLLWFLRAYNNSSYTIPPKISDDDCLKLCKWLSNVN